MEAVAETAIPSYTIDMHSRRALLLLEKSQQQRAAADMNLTQYHLRSEAAATLAKIGITGPAAEALLTETAHARHQWRVGETVRVAREIVGGGALDAAAYLVADLAGVGGREGVEGLATQRLYGLDTLGKGRKSASDGGAWMMAARDALGMLLSRADLEGSTLVPTALGVALQSGIGAQAHFDKVPAAWLLTIFREGLRRASGLGGWLDIPHVLWAGWAAEWAAAVNLLCAEMDAAMSFSEVEEA